VKISCCQ